MGILDNVEMRDGVPRRDRGIQSRRGYLGEFPAKVPSAQCSRGIAAVQDLVFAGSRLWGAAGERASLGNGPAG